MTDLITWFGLPPDHRPLLNHIHVCGSARSPTCFCIYLSHKLPPHLQRDDFGRNAQTYQGDLDDHISQSGGVRVRLDSFATGAQISVKAGGQDAPSQMLFVDQTGEGRFVVLDGQVLVLEPGQHLVVPINAEEQRELGTWLEVTKRFPDDISAALLHSLRRPDLDARLMRLEMAFPKLRLGSDTAKERLPKVDASKVATPPPNPWLPFLRQPAVIAGVVAASASAILVFVVLFALLVWPGFGHLYWATATDEDVPEVVPTNIEEAPVPDEKMADDLLNETLAAMSNKLAESPFKSVFTQHIQGMQDKALDLDPTEWDRLSFAIEQAIALQKNPAYQVPAIGEGHSACPLLGEGVEPTVVNAWLCCKKTRRLERGMDKIPEMEQQPHVCDKVEWAEVVTALEDLNKYLGEGN